MSMCYLCDLCAQPHRIDSIHWLDCSKCDELHPKAFDYGRDDPHEICKHFERKEGGDD